MDTDNSIRGMYDQCYKGSNCTDITPYFDDYRNLISKSKFYKHYEHDSNSFFTSAVGGIVDDDHREMLADYCDIDNLTVDGELKKLTKSSYDWCKDSIDPTIAHNLKLETVRNTKLRNQLKNHQVPSKYRSEKPIVSIY